MESKTSQLTQTTQDSHVKSWNGEAEKFAVINQAFCLSIYSQIKWVKQNQQIRSFQKSEIDRNLQILTRDNNQAYEAQYHILTACSTVKS